MANRKRLTKKQNNYYFPLYVNEFEGGIKGMSCEEIGAYIQLLIYQFNHGSIPVKDVPRVKKITGADIDFTYIFKKFPNGINPKMKDVCEKIKEKSDMARKSALGKWGHGKSKRTRRLADARKLGTHTKKEFQEMVDFFKGECVKCGDKKSGIVRDHIIPIYQGGSDSIDNLQPLCQNCNVSKGPDNTDYRISHCLRNGYEMPTKWLQNGCEMAAILNLNNLNLNNINTNNQSLKLKSKIIRDFSKEKSLVNAEALTPAGYSEKFVNIWNEMAVKTGLPKVSTLTAGRKRKISARLRNNGFVDNFMQAIGKIPASDFLLGLKGGWKANFDWMIDNDLNVIKILEGKYDNAKSTAELTHMKAQALVKKAQEAGIR